MSITIKTKYIVYNHAGTGVRHHHFTEQNTVHSFPDNTAEPNEPGNRTASGPSLYPFNGVELPFAFMSINGTKDGNKLYSSPGDYQYQVGNTDIDILVVYAPAGGIGGPNGEPGIWVDAFNVDTGGLSDDLHFIQILTPPTPPDTPDNPKTNEANLEGDVSSLNPEHIRASATIDNGVPFVQWKQIMPPQQIVNSRDFNLAKNETGEIWIAFYQTQTQTPIALRPDDYAFILPWVDKRDFIDGGPHPMFHEIMEFAMGLSLVGKSENVHSKLRGELLVLAAKQIKMASDAIQKKIIDSSKDR
ncbi:MAG: hypothetical protein M0Q44_21500 [Methylobacter sp.]|jgi:hypothetical protein|nr:hypothetical protein [Methylobacter sp.]